MPNIKANPYFIPIKLTHSFFLPVVFKILGQDFLSTPDFLQLNIFCALHKFLLDNAVAKEYLAPANTIDVQRDKKH